MSRLRRERNIFAVAALLMILATMGVSLPRALARREKLKGLNTDLINLQRTITFLREHTRLIQTEITKTQGEIRVRQSQH